MTIRTGYVAQAAQIDVQAGATLIVQDQATLNVANPINSAAVLVTGRMSVDGTLSILNANSFSGAPFGGHGIHVQGKMLIGSTGVVDIDQAEQGIYIESSGICSTKGQLTIWNIDAACIYNHGAFYNKGTMQLTAGTSVGQVAITSFKKFYNFSSGTITTEGGGSSAVNNNSAGIMVNHGDWAINNADNGGLTVAGTFYNYYSGDLDITNAGYKGIYVSFSGQFINYGHTESTSSLYGMLNYGYSKNTGTLNLLGTSYSYRDWTSSLMENHGVLYMQSFGTTSAYVYSDIINHDKGNLIIYEKCYFNSNSLLENHGIVTSDYTGSHWKHATAQIVNYKIMNDIHGSFGSTIDNQQVVTQPLTDPMQDGVAFANPLDVFSLSDVTIGSWTTYPGGPIAGTYDAATNEFTPNSSAIGATELRVIMTNNSSGYGYLTTVKLASPIAALVAQPDLGIQGYEAIHAQPSNDTKVYPNPSVGQFEVTSTLFDEGPVQLEVYSLMGQLVFSKGFAQYDKPQIQLPTNLPNGQYLLRLIDSTGNTNTQALDLLK